VATHDGRELRRGVDALRKRVEKHFGDADEPDTSRGLVAKVLASCEERFAREIERMQTVPRPVYGDEFVMLGVAREDVAKWFSGAR
jgi:exocyst complex component 1